MVYPMISETDISPKGADALMDYFIMEWIAIKAKQPPLHENVLVFFGGNDMEAVQIKALGESWDGRRRAWYPGGQDYENATHWMPLPPAPPKTPPP